MTRHLNPGPGDYRLPLHWLDYRSPLFISKRSAGIESVASQKLLIYRTTKKSQLKVFVFINAIYKVQSHINYDCALSPNGLLCCKLLFTNVITTSCLIKVMVLK